MEVKELRNQLLVSSEVSSDTESPDKSVDPKRFC